MVILTSEAPSSSDVLATKVKVPSYLQLKGTRVLQGDAIRRQKHSRMIEMKIIG